MMTKLKPGALAAADVPANIHVSSVTSSPITR
jgi:hypothetical protein